MKTQRLDKFIANRLGISRKEAHIKIYKGNVAVNDNIVIKPSLIISSKDIISCDNIIVPMPNEFEYYVLNKPSGYITAEKDKFKSTVMELLPPNFSKEKIMPVGRLDIDTTGLLLFTNNGKLAYRLLSPKREIYKTYFAIINRDISSSDIENFKKGLNLGDFISKPATLYTKSNIKNEGFVDVCEGKFHQIKRMFEAVDAKVLKLSRIKFGPLTLDVQEGHYRALSNDEIKLLFEACDMLEKEE